jgi:hypothetical protein
LKSAETGVSEVEAFCARRFLDDLSEPHCGLPSATRTPVHTGVSVGRSSLSRKAVTRYKYL